MNLKTRKTLKIISNIPVILVTLLAFLLYGLRLFGLQPYSVLSGSMESVYPTGSLIYVAKVEPQELQVNDIITFRMSGEAIATHRIIELVADETDPDTIRFRTKGDENEMADGTLVEFGSVIGKPTFCIPLLGYLATYIMSTSGKFVALSVAAALVLLEIIVGMVLEDKGKHNEN